MAYYQGDYYQGDYYHGDPFLGLGAIFGAAKWIGKKVFGRKKPGRAMMTQSIAPMAAAPFMGRVASSGIGSIIGRGIFRDRQLRAMGQKVPGVRGTIQRILPGGATGYESAGCKPGQYLQVKDGEPTGKCLYRRMNVTNSRALRRSLRRVSGFGKLASRARRDIGRAAAAVGAGSRRRGPVTRHHARIRARAA